MADSPKRRWSFSLRTLFVVVTVLAVPIGWLSWNLNWVRQRESWRLRTADARRATLANDAPGLLWLFREHGESWIEMKIGTAPEEIAAVQQLFPEAIVIVAGQQPTEQQRKSYNRIAEKSFPIAPAPAPRP